MDADVGHVIPPGCVEVSRIMHPDDANFAGNVHGGTILKIIEEAGEIVATRYCNKPTNGSDSSEKPYWAVLARVERTDFLQPLFIGEVAQVHAEISYASERSVEVKFLVWAENLLTSSKRLTNKAWMWYVPVHVLPDRKTEIGRVPPLIYPDRETEESGRKRYELQKKQREEKQKDLEKIPNNFGRALFPDPNSPPHSVTSSQSTLIHPVSPSNCNKFGYVHGGVTMKLMDTVAGMTAFRHCRTNVVTASIAPVDFHEPVPLGIVLTFTGRLTFTSSRSMEVEVMVDAEDIRKGQTFRACSAFFTFVSLDPKGQSQTVPQLVLVTDEEKERWEEGKKRYEERKKARTLSSEGKK